MAGTKLNNFSTVNVNLTAMMTTLTAMYKGLFKLSLTDFDTDVRPKVATGSIIDLNGSLYLFDEETAATVTISDGIVFMKIIPSGSTASVVFTAVEPEWSDSKQGWYETGTSHRYIAKMIKSGTAYSQKILYDKQDIAKIRETIVSQIAGNNTTTLIHELTFSFNIGAIVNYTCDSTTILFEYIDSFVASDYTLTITRKSVSDNFVPYLKYSVVITAEEI